MLRSIDLMKYVMALSVIAIHVSATCAMAYPPVVRWFIWLAVPFFFGTTGYLLRRSHKENRAELRHRALRVGKVWLLWVLLYLPFALLWYRHAGHGITADVRDYFVMLLETGTAPNAYHLWYLYALIFALAIMALCVPLSNRRLLLLFVLFSGIYVVNFYQLATPFINTLCDRPLAGGMYVIGGMLLYELKQRISPRALMATGCLLLEAGYLLFASGLPFWRLLSALGVIGCCLTVTIRRGGDAFFLALRRQSMWIYYIHPAVIILLKINRQSALYPSLALVSVVCMLLALILYKIGEKWPPINFLVK